MTPKSWFLSTLRRPASLRLHLILLIVITMIPLLIFSVAMIVRFDRDQRATFEKGATDRTRALLTAVDTELKRSIAALEAFAASQELATDDLRGFREEAARVLKNQRDWFTINLAAPSGQQLLNLLRPPGTELPMIRERDSFERVLRTGKPAAGHVINGPVTERLEFSVRVPVLRQGGVRYVLSAVVKPQSISQLLLAQRLPPDWIGVVLDGNRRFVARTIEPERNVGQPASQDLRAALDRGPEGWFHGRTIEGWDVYTPYNRSDFSGWTVAMGIPIAAVEASLHRSLFYVAGFGFALLTLAIALAWFLGSRTAKSIGSLTDLAEDVGMGKKSTTAANNVPGVIAEVEDVREALLNANRLIQEHSVERDRVEQALRRQADLLEMTHDAIFVWEFPRGPIVYWNRGAEALYGFPKAGAIGMTTSDLLATSHPRGVEFFKSTLEHDGKWYGELTHTTRNGRQIVVESRHILVQESDKRRLVLETNRDITARKQMERRRDASFAVTQILAESPSLNDATQRILRTIGERLAWDIGDLWIPDWEANALRCLNVWHDASVPANKFVSASYELTFAPGVGLPGRVWRSLKPAWIADVTQDDSFLRAPFAAEAGLHAGFAFPIVFGGKCLGVMDFFSREIREPDHVLLALFASIGSQIGQFMERKRGEAALERSRDEFARMAATTPDFLFVYDLIEGRTLYGNKRLEELLGYTGAELPATDGNLVVAVARPEDVQALQAYFRQFNTAADGEVLEHIHMALHADGTHRCLHTRATIFDWCGDGRPRSIIGHMRDITNQKQLEAEREQLLHLAERARADAEQANRFKDHFIAILGHELRNPLNVISTAAQLLGKEGPPQLELKEFHNIIESEALQMARLLDDLLDVSRVGRGLIRLNKERLDFAEIVRQVAEGRRPVLQESGIALAVQLPEQPLWLMGDRTRLAQIVANLLQNAHKFTERGGNVTVKLVESASDGVAELTVRDTGIGMEPEMLARVFEPFVQADQSLERSRGGLGLGLALVKGLVDLHGGEARAASQGAGQGAEFTIRLPLVKTTARVLVSKKPAVAAT